MHHNTWQSNGLRVDVNASAGPPVSTCDYYAFWTDKGCRTWSLGNTKSRRKPRRWCCDISWV